MDVKMFHVIEVRIASGEVKQLLLDALVAAGKIPAGTRIQNLSLTPEGPCTLAIEQTIDRYRVIDENGKHF